MFGSNSTEDLEAVEDLRRQLRQRYIDIVVVAAVDSADAMDQVNAVMTSLLQRSREINLAAQVSFSMLCRKFNSQFKTVKIINVPLCCVSTQFY